MKKSFSVLEIILVITLLGFLYTAFLPKTKINNLNELTNKISLYITEVRYKALIDDKYEIQRFKGLGEMNPDEGGKAITNPETRKIKQLTIEDAELCRETLNILMGDKAEFRKIWIAENLDFSGLYDLI